MAVDIDSASPRREIADSSVCLFVGKRRISNRLCPGSDWYRRGPWNDWSGGGGSRPGIGDDERSLDDLEILLVGLEEQQKQELLASVLASKVSSIKLCFY